MLIISANFHINESIPEDTGERIRFALTSPPLVVPLETVVLVATCLPMGVACALLTSLDKLKKKKKKKAKREMKSKER